MKHGEVWEFTVTDKAVCPKCGNENVGNIFLAQYIGPISTDAGNGKRFEPIDFTCLGCGAAVDEYIDWDDAEAQRESVGLSLVAHGA